MRMFSTKSLLSSMTAISLVLVSCSVACNDDRADLSSPEEEVGVVSSELEQEYEEQPEEQDDPNYDYAIGQWMYQSQDPQADPKLYTQPDFAGRSFMASRYPDSTFFGAYYDGYRTYSCNAQWFGVMRTDVCANSVLQCPPHSINTGASCLCDTGYAGDGGVCKPRTTTWGAADDERLPSDDRGRWLGIRGDSEFQPYHPEDDYGIYSGRTIKFVRGRADLSRFAKSPEDPRIPAILSLAGLDGSDEDFKKGRAALSAVFKQIGRGDQISRVKKYLRDNKLIMHHYDCTLQIVSKQLHTGLGHAGAASDMREGRLNCPQ